MNAVATFVGFNHYKRKFFEPLRCAEADARDLADELADQKVCAREARFIGSAAPASDATEILKQLEHAFLIEAQPENTVLVYFSGHGTTDSKGLLYLCLPGTDIGTLQSTAIPVQRIAGLASRSRARHVLVWLDCCVGGTAGRSFSAEHALDKGVGKDVALTLYCAANDRSAFEREGFANSDFTHFLLDGIRTGYADLDNDGVISEDELFAYVASNISVLHGAAPVKFQWAQSRPLAVARNRSFHPLPPVEQIPPHQLLKFFGLQYVVDTLRRTPGTAFMLVLAGYYLDGHPYKATALTVTASHTPNARLTSRGFESDAFFTGDLLNPEDKRGKTPFIVALADGNTVKLFQVRLEARFEDISIAAFNRPNGQTETVFQDAEAFARIATFPR
jgi:hypothetical protein